MPSKDVKNPIKPIRIPRIPCPNPSIEIISPTKAYFDKSEFSSAQLNHPHGGDFNSKVANKRFFHTILWKPKHQCCQVVKARLVVKMKSLRGGRSLHSPDAGNDNISIVKNGGINIISERVYSGHPFNVGKSSTKSWTLSGSQLDWLNFQKKLSIYVQDDTSIKSIKLKLWVCCLSKPKKEDIKLDK